MGRGSRQGGKSLAALLLGALGGCNPLAGAEPAAPPTWTLTERSLPFVDWRSHLAVSQREAWLGGTVAFGAEGGFLYRLVGSHWTPVRAADSRQIRTQVLGLDPEGGLWLAAYEPVEEGTYGGLEIRRFDGERWRVERVSPGIWPQALDMVSAEEGWIAGNRGRLLHRTRQGWQRVDLEGPWSETSAPSILAIRMISAEEGWLVGSQGLIAHLVAGRWRLVSVPEALAGQKLFGVDWLSEDGSLWVAGTSGAIGRYRHGDWQLLDTGTIQPLMGLDMLTPEDGWAVGGQGTILHWDGVSWRAQPSPTRAQLDTVAMAGPARGWIAGPRVLLSNSESPAGLLSEVSELPGFAPASWPAQQVAAVDFDGDGDTDLVTATVAGIRLWENQGGESFLESVALAPAPQSPLPATLEDMAWGDVDGNGTEDVVVLTNRPLRLWLARGLGGGRFSGYERLPGNPSFGLSEAFSWVSLEDLDGDGDLDLYLTLSSSLADGALSNWTLLNDGVGRFGVALPGSGGGAVEHSILWGDLDGDRDLDAVLPSYGTGLRWIENDGHGRFLDRTAGSGLDRVVAPGRMQQGLLVDLDRDGDLDLLVQADRLQVLLNDGHAHFQAAPELFGELANNSSVITSRLAVAGDLDLDGWPEVLLQSAQDNELRLHVFHRGGDGRWHDEAQRFGLEGISGESATLFDFDADGDLDLFVASSPLSHFFLNRTNNSNWLEVQLEGSLSQARGRGAALELWPAGARGRTGSLVGYQQLGLGVGPTSKSVPSSAHFGLPATGLYDLVVRFPSGREVVRSGLEPGTVVQVPELAWSSKFLVAIAAALHRTWLHARLGFELARLAAVLALVLAWRRLAARVGARLFCQRRTVAAVLVLLYVGLALATVAEPWGRARLVELAVFALLLGGLAAADRWLSRLAGSRYLGPFRLENVLGEGGMGRVYRARDIAHGRDVALKILRTEVRTLEGHRQRFQREARLLGELRHPNIVPVYSTGEIDGQGFISMELLSGRTLKQQLEEAGPLAPKAAAELLLATCDALGHIHRSGVLHRDLKSENLFLVDSAAAESTAWGPRLRLMDFGLARPLSGGTLTAGPAFLGTLAYMSPEQLRGEDLDARSDLYSLGVVAYEALTGRLPFEAEDTGALVFQIQTGRSRPLEDLCPQLPGPWLSLVGSLLGAERTGRPSSAEEVAAALRPLAALDSPPETTPRLAAPAPSRASLDLPLWRAKLAAAEELWAAGCLVEAEASFLDCVVALRRELKALPLEARRSYWRDHGASAVTRFEHRLGASRRPARRTA